MLTNGVERVIEQLVNPKIPHIIKPKIDEVICKQLGIDPEKRKEHVEQTKQQHMEKMQNMQSLMNVTPGLFSPNLKHPRFLFMYLHLKIFCSDLCYYKLLLFYFREEQSKWGITWLTNYRVSFTRIPGGRVVTTSTCPWPDRC